MKNWTIHWLTAAGDLAEWECRINTQIEAAHTALSRFVELSPLDILIERSSEGVVPELGMRARAERSNLISVLIDPYNDNFDAALARAHVTRQLVRATHLAIRLAGPGYGFTLSGAMISEGLAGQFTRLVLSSAPEPWDIALDDLDQHWPAQRELMTPKYDHGLWFEGTGDKPRWLGHTLGFKLVENWLTSGAEITPHRMIDIPAPKVMSAALAREIAS